jgi:DNA-binding CsgD family transcriptional regulator
VGAVLETPDARVARWLGIVSDLLCQPVSEVPRLVICQQLHLTFDLVGSLWYRRGPGDASESVGIPSVEQMFSAADNEWMLTSEAAAMHPLQRWYAATGDPRPQSLNRVPTELAPRRDRVFVSNFLGPAGVDRQLAIPFRMGAVWETFILGRTGADFSDEDLEVAYRIQPAFVALEHQTELLSHFMPPDAEQAVRAAQLTGRELAVLRLLAQGHTAFGIAVRLSSSPRTVHKHLEHVYRKLEVSDRLTAVRLASELHLIPERPPVA